MRCSTWTWGVVALLAGALACSDGSGVGLTFTTRGTRGSTTAQNGDSTVVVRGTDTLVIKSVEIVLKEVELERVEHTTDCPDSTGDDDDACEEFTVGLQLVSLPLGNGADRIVTVDLPAGIYDEVEFEIHKPDASRDAAFIAAHPEFAGVSIRATGTFIHAGTRTDFVYTTDLNSEQEVELDPPLDVAAAGPVNLTIRLDIATWFLAGTALIDPATANKGGANEGLVRDNIKESIDAFHDDDGDGRDDDDEDDDDDGDDEHEDDDDGEHGDTGSSHKGPGT